MVRDVDLHKTLQELDGQDWGEPTYDSYLVRTCHRLRRVPLRDFTVEDLRMMIGQGIAHEYLVPLALDRLTADPLVAGHFYPGDLLKNVLAAPPAFWTGHPDLLARTADIAKLAMKQLGDRSQGQHPASASVIRNGIEQFLQQRSSAVLTPRSTHTDDKPSAQEPLPKTQTPSFDVGVGQ